MTRTQEATKLALVLADKLQRREPPRLEELERALNMVLESKQAQTPTGFALHNGRELHRV